MRVVRVTVMRAEQRDRRGTHPLREGGAPLARPLRQGREGGDALEGAACRRRARGATRRRAAARGEAAGRAGCWPLAQPWPCLRRIRARHCASEKSRRDASTELLPASYRSATASCNPRRNTSERGRTHGNDIRSHIAPDKACPPRGVAGNEVGMCRGRPCDCERSSERRSRSCVHDFGIGSVRRAASGPAEPAARPRLPTRSDLNSDAEG